MRTSRHICFLAAAIFILAFQVQAQSSVEVGDSVAKSIALENVRIRATGTKPVVRGIDEGVVRLIPTTLSSLPTMLGTTDLLKLLQLTPSVQNAGDANTDIYIRGGEAGQNLLLYNGVPLYSPGHLAGIFPLFNSDHISSLELRKSGIAAQYGGRLSSVIDVQTKSELPQKVAIAGNLGLLASQATLAVPMGSKFGLYLSGRKTYINEIIMPVVRSLAPEGSLDGMGYDFYDGNITLVGELSEKNKVKANVFLGKDKLHVAEKDIFISGALGWSNAAFSLQWDTKIGSCNFSQQAYSSAYSNSLDVQQVKINIEMLSDIRDWGYKNRLGFMLGSVSFETGLQYAWHSINPQNLSMVNDGQSYNVGSVDRQQAHDAAAYLGSSVDVTDNLKFDAGLRYNFFYCEKKFGSLDPRLALRYSLSDEATLRAGYSRQHQYVNLLTPSTIGLPTNFWIAASNEVKVQSGDEFSVGYVRSFRDNAFDISAEAYYRQMHNLTEYSLSYSNDYIADILYGAGRAYGVELIVKKNLGKLTGWLSYALGRSERSFSEINEGETFPAKFDRRHDLSLVATYAFNSKWDASLVQTYATGNAYTQPSSWYFINNIPVREYGSYNGARMPNYNRTDISVNYWFRKNNGINFSVYNVFMVNNPIYVFLKVGPNEKTGKLEIQVRSKTLYTIMPSISWRFKF